MKTTRVPASGGWLAGQNWVLRSSVITIALTRELVSWPRASIPSAVAIAPASSARWPPVSESRTRRASASAAV